MLIKEVIRIDSLFKEITTDNVNDKKHINEVYSKNILKRTYSRDIC